MIGLQERIVELFDRMGRSMHSRHQKDNLQDEQLVKLNKGINWIHKSGEQTRGDIAELKQVVATMVEIVSTTKQRLDELNNTAKQVENGRTKSVSPTC
jgi:uncharacterized coiled-coil DUF342 family protein